MKLLLIIGIGLLIPSWLCRQLDHPTVDWLRTQRGFNPVEERQRLSREKPNWVLIGNSMLGTRIDEDKLSKISGLHACKVYRAGSQSAVWFLILKKLVLTSEARPKWVTVFFRETDLTWPDFRVDGLQEGAIRAMNGHEQPEWHAVLRHDATVIDRTLDYASGALKSLLPSYHLNQQAHDYVQSKPMRLTRVGNRLGINDRRAELNERFSLSHLRHDLGSDAEPSAAGDDDLTTDFYRHGPQKFDPSPAASFLPHLITVAKAHGIRLHFHRIKQRPRKAGGDRQDSPERVAYMQALGQWLGSQGCVLTDESKDASLTLDMYADGDHIKEEPTVSDKYHAAFWARVKSAIAP